MRSDKTTARCWPKIQEFLIAEDMSDSSSMDSWNGYVIEEVCCMGKTDEIGQLEIRGDFTN